MSAFWIQLALLVFAAFTFPTSVKSSSLVALLFAYVMPAICVLAALAVWIVDRCVQ